MSERAEPAFDEIIHPYNRLQICAMLSGAESLAFAEVRDALGVSDSVLSKQVKVLQEAGYVAVHKETRQSRIRAWLSMTPEGRKALASHLAQLRLLAEAAERTGD